MKPNADGWPIQSRAICGAILLLVAACSRPDLSVDPAAPRLRLVTSFRINSLVPTDPRSYFLPEFGIAELLVRLDAEGRLQGWLLESFAPEDERNWRLVLRRGVRFHNGRPLDATALAASMNRQLEQSASAAATLPGARVRVAGEYEVVLTTIAPDATVPNALADELVFPVYDVEAVEAPDGGYAAGLLGSGCYTGPYRVVSLDEREMRMVRFDGYWRGRPPLAEVSVRFVLDAQARVLAVQNDEADIALYPPSEAQRMLAGRSDAFFVAGRRSHGGPRLLLNVRRPPFDDLLVRRAFGLGIDYESLATDVLEGIAETATGFYPSVWPWAVANQKTDLDEARRLLDEAGWRTLDGGVREKGSERLEVTLLVYPQQPDFAALATAIQAQLREIGFRVQIRQVEDINAAMREGRASATSGGFSAWHAAFNSPGLVTTGGAPDPFLHESLTSRGERNYGGVNDPELDAMVDELGRSFNAARRALLLGRIQQIVIAERVYEVRPVFLRPRVVVGRRWRTYQPSPQLHHITYETRPDQSTDQSTDQ
jgi:peptide/nickel transport system substrate-binding protein